MFNLSYKYILECGSSVMAPKAVKKVLVGHVDNPNRPSYRDHREDQPRKTPSPQVLYCPFDYIKTFNSSNFNEHRSLNFFLLIPKGSLLPMGILFYKDILDELYPMNGSDYQHKTLK